MPKASEITSLSPQRQKAYRAIWSLWERSKASPSQTEIAAESGLLVGNLHPVLGWLEVRGWIAKKPNQHRSIVPLVRLPKREARRSA